MRAWAVELDSVPAEGGGCGGARFGGEGGGGRANSDGGDGGAVVGGDSDAGTFRARAVGLSRWIYKVALHFANIPSWGVIIASFVKFWVGGPLIQRLLEQRFRTKFVYFPFLQILAKYAKVVGDALNAPFQVLFGNRDFMGISVD